MTLIAAFRTYDGAVACADSQETLTVPSPDGYADYRCRVDKIKPQIAGQYQLVIGGSGDGPLVDGFADALTDAVSSWQEKHDAPTVKGKIRQLLLDYHRNEVAVSPAYDKNLAFIVCLRHMTHGSDVLLYELRGPTVKVVTTYSLVGWEEAVYRHEVEQLYQTNWAHNRSLMLGIHLFMLAKNTSNVIGGDTKTVIATPNTIWGLLAQSDVAEIEGRIEGFNKAISDLILVCPDLTIHQAEFEGYLQNLVDYVNGWRNHYLYNALSSTLARSKDGLSRTESAYEHIPRDRAYWISSNTEGLPPSNDPKKTPKVIEDTPEMHVKPPSLSPPSDSQTSEDRQSPCNEASQETDQSSSDD